MPDDTGGSRHQPIVIVTGPAGAGRSTAIRALEDFGYEAIDNLPLSLLERLLAGPPLARPLAVGVDPRTRDFAPQALLNTLTKILAKGDNPVQLLYVDCSVEVLLQRFSETRRRHPLARDTTPRLGIEREMAMLAGLRNTADILIDTTDLSPHDLRHELARQFAQSQESDLSVSVQSFAFKRGVPRSLDMVMDLRFLRNPHWDPDLRAMDGRDAPVQEYVRTDPLYERFIESLSDITFLLLPAYKAEGKSYFSLGLGCTGGQHRSVFVAETFANALAEKGWQVSIRHRELERVGEFGRPDSGAGEA